MQDCKKLEKGQDCLLLVSRLEMKHYKFISNNAFVPKKIRTRYKKTDMKHSYQSRRSNESQPQNVNKLSAVNDPLTSALKKRKQTFVYILSTGRQSVENLSLDLEKTLESVIN